MAQRLSTQAHERGHDGVAERFEARKRERRRRAEAVRAVVAEGNGAVPLDQQAAELRLPEAVERALASEVEPAATHGSGSAQAHGTDHEELEHDEPEPEAEESAQ